MAKNSKKKSFKSKDTKVGLTLGDFYTQSELFALPSLNYMKPVDIIAKLKTNNITPLVLKPPFNNQKVWLKEAVDNYIDEKLN
jgi:hypothetical protein